jgi:hypothetical protein
MLAPLQEGDILLECEERYLILRGSKVGIVDLFQGSPRVHSWREVDSFYLLSMAALGWVEMPHDTEIHLSTHPIEWPESPEPILSDGDPKDVEIPIPGGSTGPVGVEGPVPE